MLYAAFVKVDTIAVVDDVVDDVVLVVIVVVVVVTITIISLMFS